MRHVGIELIAGIKVVAERASLGFQYITLGQVDSLHMALGELREPAGILVLDDLERASQDVFDEALELVRSPPDGWQVVLI